MHYLTALTFSLSVLTSFTTATKSLLFHKDFVGVEVEVARALHWKIDVLDNKDWAKLTTKDFSSYDALVIGADIDLRGHQIYETREKWSEAIKGNIVALGNCSTSAKQVVKNGLEYATLDKGTGLYITLIDTPSAKVLDKILVPEVIALERGIVSETDNVNDEVEVITGKGPIHQLTASIRKSGWECYGDFVASSLFPNRRLGFTQLTHHQKWDVTVQYPYLHARAMSQNPEYNAKNEIVSRQSAGLFSTHGDWVHISSTPPAEASGHGWWQKATSFSATHAVVTIWMQARWVGTTDWVTVGTGSGTYVPGPGSGRRATARKRCTNLVSRVEFKTIIDVDIIGYWDTPEKAETPAQILYCGAF